MGDVFYLQHMNVEHLTNIAGTSLMNFFPFLQYIPGDPFQARKVIKLVRSIENTFVRTQVDAHFKAHEEGTGCRRDFIDTYVKEIFKKKSSGLPTTIDGRRLYSNYSID